MKTRVQKLGDGLAVTIPAAVAAQSGLAENAEVDITVENGAVVARPVSKPRYTLDELLQTVTDDQLHPETNTGPAVGRNTNDPGTNFSLGGGGVPGGDCFMISARSGGFSAVVT